MHVYGVCGANSCVCIYSWVLGREGVWRVGAMISADLFLHCFESVAMLHKMNIVLSCPFAVLLLVVLVHFGLGLFSGCT